MRLAEIASLRARVGSVVQPLPEGDFSGSVGIRFTLREKESLSRIVKRLVARQALAVQRARVRRKLGFDLPFPADAIGVGERFVEEAAWSYLLDRLPRMSRLSVLVPGCYMGGEDVQFWLRRGVRRLDGIDVYALTRHWDTIIPTLRQRWAVPVGFRQGSIEDIPFETSSFDVITSAAVLEHVRNIDVMVDETARVLKSGGFALHSFGPLYYCFGADHCIGAYGLEAGYDHVMLDEAEYRRRIADRAFFEKAAQNPDLGFWAVNDQFSFATAAEYIASFKTRFDIDYLAVKISAEGTRVQNALPGQVEAAARGWHQRDGPARQRPSHGGTQAAQRGHEGMRSILYVQYTDPSAYPPLEHSSLMLADRGWKVRFLGTMAGGMARRLELPRHTAISVSLMPARPRGLRQALHYARFLAWCRSEVQRSHPDVVYCSDFLSFPVGLWASTAGVQTVLHEHDPPLASGGGHLLRVMRGIRRRFARRASHIVIPQEERARRFIAEVGCDASRTHIVYNCPSRREIELLRSTPREPKAGMTFWFHGTISPGLLPLAVIDALARLPSDVRLEVAGYETVSSRGYVAQLLARADELGIGDRVHCHGVLPQRADLLRTASSADVGLVLFANQFRDPMVGASNKPFDYLACGLPLLINGTPEWESFFGAERVSIGCDRENPDEIARAVLALRNDPERRRRMAETGRHLIATRWNYETQFQPVIELIEGVFQSRPR